MIYNLESDYTEGALPEIMEALVSTNLEQTTGYGEDPHCENARRLILGAARRAAQVFFCVGGTQANMLVLTAALRPHEAALCVESGHINTHETGAPEAAGHKVITVSGADKLTPADIEHALNAHMPIHTAKPRLVYISQSTEWGTVYTRDELQALYALCRQRGLYLFIDGARLGCGMAAAGMELSDIAANCDAFTIGGTKNGALFGEAIVISAPELAADFSYIMKQRGALLAKGRLLGIQFERLFSDDLYMRAARHACAAAQRMAAAFAEKGIPMFIKSPTNQIFPILDSAQFARLSKEVRCMPMDALDDGRNVVRLATSWATSDAAVDAVCAAIAEM